VAPDAGSDGWGDLWPSMRPVPHCAECLIAPPCLTWAKPCADGLACRRARSMLLQSPMKTLPRAPHFLRVTQALAFVSGLGTCFVGCGGQVDGGAPGVSGFLEGPEDASLEYEGSGPDGIHIAPDAASFVTGISVAPDATAPNDAARGFDGYAGARDAPAGDTDNADVTSVPDDAGSFDGVGGGGIGPPPDDASKRDVVTGILVAPDAGRDAMLEGSVVAPPNLPAIPV